MLTTTVVVLANYNKNNSSSNNKGRASTGPADRLRGVDDCMGTAGNFGNRGMEFTFTVSGILTGVGTNRSLSFTDFPTCSDLGRGLARTGTRDDNFSSVSRDAATMLGMLSRVIPLADGVRSCCGSGRCAASKRRGNHRVITSCLGLCSRFGRRCNGLSDTVDQRGSRLHSLLVRRVGGSGGIVTTACVRVNHSVEQTLRTVSPRSPTGASGTRVRGLLKRMGRGVRGLGPTRSISNMGSFGDSTRHTVKEVHACLTKNNNGSTFGSVMRTCGSFVHSDGEVSTDRLSGGGGWRGGSPDGGSPFLGRKSFLLPCLRTRRPIGGEGAKSGPQRSPTVGRPWWP